MDDLLNETRMLVDKVKQSDTYKSYIESKKTLEQKPNLNTQFDDFRKRCFEIQLDHNYGYYNCYEQLVNLKNAHDELLSNPLVKEFMDNELKMTKMISSMINLFIDEVNFDVDFLE